MAKERDELIQNCNNNLREKVGLTTKKKKQLETLLPDRSKQNKQLTNSNEHNNN